MKKLEKVKFVAQTFADGAVAQLKEPVTIGLAAGVGLIQGFKYNGSVKRGINGGIAILVVYGIVGGYMNVANKWNNINKI